MKDRGRDAEAGVRIGLFTCGEKSKRIPEISVWRCAHRHAGQRITSSVGSLFHWPAAHHVG